MKGLAALPKLKCQVNKQWTRKEHLYNFILSGSGPVAPPRSTRKSKGMLSAEPSPAPSRMGTLPRKPSSSNLLNSPNPMAGRPLPPPPPVLAKSSPPPPALPKKSASVTQMAAARYPQSAGQRQSQPGIPMPSGQNNRIPTQSQFAPYPQNTFQYPPQQLAQPYPQNSQIHPYPPNDDWNSRGQTSYLDEMRLAPKVR